MLALSLMLLACTGPTDTGEPQQDDCTPASAAEDLNEDGVRDTCEDALLFEHRAEGDKHLYAETSSTTMGFQLAYDTTGAVSTWVTFEPALTVSQTEPGPVKVGVDGLSGWDEVDARLTDDADEQITLYLSFPDDGERVLYRDSESDLGKGVLARDVINAVEFECLEWTPSEEHPDAVGVRWALYGAPVD